MLYDAKRTFLGVEWNDNSLAIVKCGGERNEDYFKGASVVIDS